MQQHSDFSYSHYIDTLKKAMRMGYQVIPFNKLEQNLNNSFVVMRHDIDFSPSAAVNMARLEHEIGLSTTYFPQLHSYFYSVFGDKEFPIHKMLELGHDLGYHYDVKFMKFFRTVMEGLKTEIRIMEKFTQAKVSAFSQHAPSIDSYDAVEIPGYVDAYALSAKHSIKYLSDSVQRWREGCFCQHLGKHKQLQVLVHPELWTEEGLDREKIIAQLRSSAIGQIESKYTWLSEVHRYYLANKEIPDGLKDYDPIAQE